MCVFRSLAHPCTPRLTVNAAFLPWQSQFPSMYPVPALHPEYCLDAPLLSEVR
eukprot:CAMPEP_0113283636 /NCGR_PEP_ID=MMETSP0008_2-20120614/29556_1 /TAXON_ID=97485 /ORGANISM="Prymnesium parvum" /LENGTH=52 /DNA_ID=CAMNT_0000134365 /DNA_START=30 /DNA_END=185 /DNA_ORIENTATION=- /assembly_acc=CAM_ASM_000153